MGRGANCLTTRSPGAASTRRGNAIWNGMVKATGATQKAVTGSARLGARAFRAYNGFLSERFGMDRRQRLMSFGIISGAGLMALSAPVLGIVAAGALMAPQLKAMRDKQLRKNIAENGAGAGIEENPDQSSLSNQEVNSQNINNEQRGEDGLTAPERMLLQKINELNKENQAMSAQFDNFVRQETERQKAKARQAVINFQQETQASEVGGNQAEASPEAVEEIQNSSSGYQPTAEEINQSLAAASKYIQETSSENFDFDQAQQQISPDSPEATISYLAAVETSNFLEGEYADESSSIVLGLDDPESMPTFNNEDGDQISLPSDFYPAAEKQLKSRDINETELLYRAYQICCAEGKVSPTLLMKSLNIGYPKARQLVARLIANGMLPPAADENGSVQMIPLFSSKVNRNTAKKLSQENHPVFTQARQMIAAHALNSPGKKLTPKNIAENYQMNPAVSRQILRDLVDNKVINKNRVNLQTSASSSSTGNKKASKKKDTGLARVEVSDKLNPAEVSGENFNKEKYLAARKVSRYQSGNGIMALKPHFSEHILNGDANGWEIKSVPANFLSEGGRVAIYTSSPISAVSGYVDIDKIYRGSPEEVWEQIKDQPDFGYTEEEFWGHCGHKKTVCVFKANNVQRLETPVTLTEIGHLNEKGKEKTIMGSHGIKESDAGLDKMMDIFDNNDASIAEKNNGLVSQSAGSETPDKIIPIALQTLAKEEKKFNTTYSAMKRHRSDDKQAEPQPA
jgi:predicted transcriptional regulator